MAFIVNLKKTKKMNNINEFSIPTPEQIKAMEEHRREQSSLIQKYMTSILIGIKKQMIKCEDGNEFEITLPVMDYYRLVNIWRFSVPNSIIDNKHYNYDKFMQYITTIDASILNGSVILYKTNHDLCLGFLFHELSRRLIFPKVEVLPDELSRKGEKLIKIKVIYNRYLDKIEEKLGFNPLTEEVAECMHFDSLKLNIM